MENYLGDLFVTIFMSFVGVFIQLWWIWVPVLLFSIFIKIFDGIKSERDKDRRYKGVVSIKNNKSILNTLRKMTPYEFEDFIATLYFKLGYTTERVGKSHDGGIDVIAEKNGIKHYIQCKKFITNKVSVGSVRDFYGAIISEMANGNGIFITTNYFTTEAKYFAEKNMIKTIDGYKLVDLIKSVGGYEEIKKPLNNDIVERCPNCGVNLVLRKGVNGHNDFYGCSNYPKCRFIKKL